jgi:hypothetical protein
MASAGQVCVDRSSWLKFFSNAAAAHSRVIGSHALFCETPNKALEALTVSPPGGVPMSQFHCSRQPRWRAQELTTAFRTCQLTSDAPFTKGSTSRLSNIGRASSSGRDTLTGNQAVKKAKMPERLQHMRAVTASTSSAKPLAYEASRVRFSAGFSVGDLESTQTRLTLPSHF